MRRARAGSLWGPLVKSAKGTESSARGAGGAARGRADGWVLELFPLGPLLTESKIPVGGIALKTSSRVDPGHGPGKESGCLGPRRRPQLRSLLSEPVPLHGFHGASRAHLVSAVPCAGSHCVGPGGLAAGAKEGGPQGGQWPSWPPAAAEAARVSCHLPGKGARYPHYLHYTV